MADINRVELDQLALSAAIKRCPFNPHEKSSVATHRRVMALMFQDGYRAACAAHIAVSQRAEVVVSDAMVREAEIAYDARCTENTCEPDALRAALTAALRKVMDH
jgi:hypothetical protein